MSLLQGVVHVQTVLNGLLMSGVCVSLLLICGVSLEGQTTSGSQDYILANRVLQLEQQLLELKKEMAALKSGSVTAIEPAGDGEPQPLNFVSPASEASRAAPKSPSAASLLGPTSLSGFIDVYYGQNFNNPATRTNGLRFFDVASNQFGLNLIELVVDKSPTVATSRTGYHVALGYGQAMTAITGAGVTNSLSADQYLKEAYFSYLAPIGKGLQIDVGKFVTPAGFEVIETKDDYNYSRGILFSYAIPYYHFGMRAKYAFNDKYSLAGYFTNGWSNVVDNNSGKTYGVSFAWNPTQKLGVVQNYLAGPEQNDLNSNWRQLSDTVVTYSATKRLTLAANFDYGRGDRIAGIANPVYWSGIAGYFKLALAEKYSVAGRYEYFNDHYGFATGTAGHIQEVTGTFEHPFTNNILSRFEFRRDSASNPIFTKGSATSVSGETTLTAGLIFTFDSREKAK